MFLCVHSPPPARSLPQRLVDFSSELGRGLRGEVARRCCPGVAIEKNGAPLPRHSCLYAYSAPARPLGTSVLGFGIFANTPREEEVTVRLVLARGGRIVTALRISSEDLAVRGGRVSASCSPPLLLQASDLGPL
jgi:hypothetical protein